MLGASWGDGLSRYGRDHMMAAIKRWHHKLKYGATERGVIVWRRRGAWRHHVEVVRVVAP